MVNLDKNIKTKLNFNLIIDSYVDFDRYVKCVYIHAFKIQKPFNRTYYKAFRESLRYF